jgi:hypothetical protein
MKVGRAFLLCSCGGLLAHGTIKKRWVRTDFAKKETGELLDAPYEGGCPWMDLSDGERAGVVSLSCNSCELGFACRWLEQHSGKTSELKQPDFFRPRR